MATSQERAHVINIGLASKCAGRARRGQTRAQKGHPAASDGPTRDQDCSSARQARGHVAAHMKQRRGPRESVVHPKELS
eukprot:scaffold218869_cov36-Tisochrysis_lutea.AAC.4